MSNPSWHSRFAKAAAHFCGRPRVFSIAVGIIAVWVVTGPLFGYSDTWQLVINTGTTIITFLMVFPSVAPHQASLLPQMHGHCDARRMR